MKKTVLLIAGSFLVLSCNQKVKQDVNEQKQSEQTNGEETIEGDSATITNLNIADIPYSNADLGAFPFFTLPKNLKELNKPLQKDFDVCYFPINGVMTPFEGKLYKTFVTGVEKESFSQRYFEKSLEDYLKSRGAVKIFDGHITADEYDRYHNEDPNKGGEGDMGYTDERIKFYMIRTADKGNVYIQFTANNASGKLNILQEEVDKS